MLNPKETSLAEGDLIFLDIPNILFRSVAKGTQSWTSHVGIAFKNSDGAWMVYEGTIPFSRMTPLETFLNKSADQRFEIKRLKRPIDTSEIETMRAVATRLLKKPYDLGFNFDSRKMFCSKLTYLIYQSIGVELGEIQSFQELIEENPNGPLRFWKIWFFGRLPLGRRTVTPASQFNDMKFTTVLAGE